MAYSGAQGCAAVQGVAAGQGRGTSWGFAAARGCAIPQEFAYSRQFAPAQVALLVYRTEQLRQQPPITMPSHGAPKCCGSPCCTPPGKIEHTLLGGHVYLSFITLMSAALSGNVYSVTTFGDGCVVRSTKKGAAKCNKHCELQKSVKRRGL